MSTQVNHAGVTTETTAYRVGKVEGPFSPPKKYADGTPRPRKLWAGKPKYWVVRVMFGKSSSIMQDRRFYSLAAAQDFWKSLADH